jgi:hypothetical protein
VFLQSSAKAWESFHSHEWTYLSLPHEILAADDGINTTGKESEPSFSFKEESSLSSAHNLLRVSILGENLWLSPGPRNSRCHNETASHSTYFLVKSTTGKDGGVYTTFTFMKPTILVCTQKYCCCSSFQCRLLRRREIVCRLMVLLGYLLPETACIVQKDLLSLSRFRKRIKFRGHVWILTWLE